MNGDGLDLERTPEVCVRTKTWVFRALLVILPILVLAVGAEVVLRVAAAREQARNEEALAELYADRPPMQNAVATLPDLIRRNANPQIIYELIPDLNTRFMGGRVTTNAEGFRQPAPMVDKSPNTFRIVGLGDSSMFGWGVHDDETYLAVLTQRLNQSSSGVTVESLNTGVPGYNTVMELSTLKDKALAYQPDLVLIHYVGNDRRLPRFLSMDGGRSGWAKSYLADWLRNRRLGRAGSENGLFMRGVDEVPEEFAYMATDAAYHQAMMDLKRLSEVHEFEVLVVCNLWPDEFVTAAAEEAGFECLAFGDAILPYMREQGIDEIQGSSLSVGEDDPHYSALGHALIADLLAEAIRPRLAARVP